MGQINVWSLSCRYLYRWYKGPRLWTCRSKSESVDSSRGWITWSETCASWHRPDRTRDAAAEAGAPAEPAVFVHARCAAKSSARCWERARICVRIAASISVKSAVLKPRDPINRKEAATETTQRVPRRAARCALWDSLRSRRLFERSFNDLKATCKSSFSAGSAPRPGRCGRRAALGSSRVCRSISYRRKRYGKAQTT